MKNSVTYAQFAQRVRRHRTSDVLVACASVTAKAPLGDKTDDGAVPFLPSFALAGVAKAAIVHGNEHRRQPVTSRDLEAMVSTFLNLDEPFVRDRDLRSFLLRVAAEQFPYQPGPFHDLARTRALLVDAAAATNQDVITNDMWHSLLGCSLDELVALALLLWSSARSNAGRFCPQWLANTNFQPVFTSLRREVIEHVTRDHFVLTRDRFRDIAAKHDLFTPELKRYAFNPLLVGPFVARDAETYLAPVARAILFRATPGSLYYTALARHGTPFTEALGSVFETYIGQQLRGCLPDELLHDFEYEKGKRAADFIVVMPSAILVVEAKITPLTHDARLGGSRIDHDLARGPGRAMEQIEATAALIRERHPAFQTIPSDRKLLGLVVTLEPYYACTIDVVFPAATGRVPKWLVNIRELEYLVSLDRKRIDEALLELLEETDMSLSVEAAIRGSEGRNTILDAAWRQYPFPMKDIGEE